MAKVTVVVDDEVAEVYALYAAEVQVSPEQSMAEQLKRFASCNPRAPYVIIPPDVRQELEQLTNKLPIRAGDDLVGRIRDLAAVSIGNVRLGFTPPQLRELKDKAARWGLSTEQYVESVVRRILEENVLSTTPRAGEMLEAGKAAASLVGKGK